MNTVNTLEHLAAKEPDYVEAKCFLIVQQRERNPVDAKQNHAAADASFLAVASIVSKLSSMLTHIVRVWTNEHVTHVNHITK